MSFLVLINRGPVDDRVENILEFILTEIPEYSDWVDFPQECIPNRITDQARNNLSNHFVRLMKMSLDELDALMQRLEEHYYNFVYVAKYTMTQLYRIGINPKLVTYIDLQSHAIQITLEC